MKKIVVFCIFTLFLVQNPVYSATPEAGDYGIGIQMTAPQYGLSGMYNVNENISLQGVIGSWGSLGGRLIYRFELKEYYNIYGYGGVGAYLYHYEHRHYQYEDSGIRVDVGAGLEYNWKEFSEDLPAIYTNLEAGVSSFHLLTYGIGFHYYFDASDI